VFDRRSRPRVDVGIVTWNTAALTAEAVRRLLDTDQGCDLRVLVHDNASSDGTVSALAEVAPEADVEAGTANLGFARAVNRLVARSDAPWFLALNSDAWPEPGAIGALVAAAERDPGVAAAAPLLLRPDGTIEHSTHPFPSLGVAALDAVAGRRWLPPPLLDRLYLEGAWAHDRTRVVDWAVGAALLFRRAALDEVGGLDERFFMYVEDLDWCWRARAAGWKVLFEPSAVVRHVGNASGASRFGGTRPALEAANLDVFLRSTRAAPVATAYRMLSAVSAGRLWMEARRAGDVGAAGHWRTVARSHLGLDPPPPVGDPAPPVETTVAAPGAVEVAVVVATRNRAERLPRLVAALEAQTLARGRFEAVIVDDSSTDGTAQVLSRLAAASRVQLRVLRAADHGGAGAARNVGWRAARAQLIAFTDDDCVPDPGWLEAGLAAAARADVVAGRTAPPPDQRDLAQRPFSLVLDVTTTQFLETANVFYRRSDLEQVGGFDERFRHASGEDTDLGLRVAGLGREVVFEPAALVHHDVRARSPWEAVREASRWVDLPLVVRGRPWARRRLLHRWVFWKPAHPSTVAALVGVAAAVRWRPAALLVLPWLDHRLRADPVSAGTVSRIGLLPAALAVDAAEVAAMARGSLRHHTLVL
jgi:GT2 family glycosyltransferase